MKRGKRKQNFNRNIIILVVILVLAAGLFFAWKNYETNSYEYEDGTGELGSLNPAAVSGAKCTDSDNGKNYSIKGKTCLGKRCLEDSCNRNNLTEFFCGKGIIRNESYDCSKEGKICSDGACVATCTDECTTENAKQCSSIGVPQICAKDGDSDSCLEWKNLDNCGAGQNCSAGNCIIYPSCTDSDGGKNYGVKGNTLVKQNGSVSSGKNATDYCTDSKVLMEYICENNDALGVPYNCPNSCSNGACTQNSTSNSTKPDYIVANLSFVEYKNATNTTFANVTIVIKNIGTANAINISDTKVERLNNSRFFSTPALAVGQSITFSDSYQCTAAHTFNATADYYLKISELDETNNGKTAFIDCVI
ncbi:MAG: hypothetical protein RL557_310 [archaeon]